MLLVTYLAKSSPFGSAEIQMSCTICYSRNPWTGTFCLEELISHCTNTLYADMNTCNIWSEFFRTDEQFLGEISVLLLCRLNYKGARLMEGKLIQKAKELILSGISSWFLTINFIEYIWVLLRFLVQHSLHTYVIVSMVIYNTKY